MYHNNPRGVEQPQTGIRNRFSHLSQLDDSQKFAEAGRKPAAAEYFTDVHYVYPLLISEYSILGRYCCD